MASDFLICPWFDLKTCHFCTLGLFFLDVELLLPSCSFQIPPKNYFSPTQVFDHYSLTINFLLLKSNMEKEILFLKENPQKHQKEEFCIIYSIVVHASLHHLSVTV